MLGATWQIIGSLDELTASLGTGFDRSNLTRMVSLARPCEPVVLRRPRRVHVGTDPLRCLAHWAVVVIDRRFHQRPILLFTSPSSG